MKTAINIILIMIGIVSLSCSDLTETDAKIRVTMREKGYDDNIMPLSTDSYWVYEISNFDKSGAKTAMYFDTIRVTETEVKNGEYWFKTIRSSNGEIKYYKNSDTALIENCETCLNTFRPLAFWPVDLSVPNDIKYYMGKALVQNVEYDVEYNVKTISENLTLPAGNFNALRYDHYLSDVYSNMEEEELIYLWFAKNIGLVKHQIKHLNNNKNYYLYEEWLLVDYKLK